MWLARATGLMVGAVRPMALRSSLLALAAAPLLACGGTRSVAVQAPDPKAMLADLAKDPCAGSDIDLDALFAGKDARGAACTGADVPADAAPDDALSYALKVEVEPKGAGGATGKSTEFSIVLTNTDSAPLTLWFVGDLSVAPYVFDARGARLIPAPLREGCEEAPPPPPPFARAILLPGGRARAVARWDGTVPSTAPADAAQQDEGTCADAHPKMVPAPPGTYRLVFPIPLLGRAKAPAAPSVDVTVKP